jgi:hypothetical protein
METAGKLTLRKSAWIDDWYVIERVEHDGREWIESREEDGVTYGSLMKSSRISDACVEGTAVEMLGIAEAIEARGSYSAKRCMVRVVDGDKAMFMSPRNSRVPGFVPLAVADALAAQIRKVLGAGAEQP